MTRRWWLIPALGTAILGTAFAAFRALWYLPPPEQEMPIACSDGAPVLPRGASLTVLVWNIQYGASRRFRFFYDGGTTVGVDEHTVRDTLDGIAEAIRAEDPDIVILQEVDRASRRTAFLDEHAMLRERLDMPCHTAAPYHKVPYVPHPSHEHLGAVDMNLSVFSRYRIDGATRIQLPLLDESPLRRLFNLRRALLDVRLPIDGGGTLHVLDTHLSAFSHNDGTLEAQVEVLREYAAALAAEGAPWLLAGDFNALPPGDDPARIDAADVYAPTSAVQPLFDAFGSPFPAGDRDETRTYVPWGADRPDRTIDYLFHGDGVTVSDLRILRQHHALSDHLPFVVTVRLAD